MEHEQQSDWWAELAVGDPVETSDGEPLGVITGVTGDEVSVKDPEDHRELLLPRRVCRPMHGGGIRLIEFAADDSDDGPERYGGAQSDELTRTVLGGTEDTREGLAGPAGEDSEPLDWVEQHTCSDHAVRDESDPLLSHGRMGEDGMSHTEEGTDEAIDEESIPGDGFSAPH